MLSKGNWGRQGPIITQNATPANALWDAFANVSVDSDENNGFNVTIIPPVDLVNGAFTESLFYRISYGGGGISASTLERSTRRPITLAIPGTYVQVQCYLRVDPAGEIPGLIKSVSAFVTCLSRPFNYCLASGVTNMTLIPHVPQTITLIGRNARAMYLLSSDAATKAMFPVTVEYLTSLTGGAGTALGVLYGVSTAIVDPLRIPDEAGHVRFTRELAGNANVFVWFDEEL